LTSAGPRMASSKRGREAAVTVKASAGGFIDSETEKEGEARSWREGERLRENAVSALGRRGKGSEGDGVGLFFQQLDLELGVFEAGFAEFQQFRAVLEARHEFGQRHFA
jgi:hypothetical protein